MKIKLLGGLILTIVGLGVITVIAIRSFSGDPKAEKIANGEAQYKKGVKLLSTNIVEAKKQLEISLNLGYYKSVAPIGSCYLKMGDVRNAETYLRKAVDSIHIYNTENQRVIYNDLGVTLAKQHDVNNAKIFWQKASKLGSEDARNNLRNNNH